MQPTVDVMHMRITAEDNAVNPEAIAIPLTNAVKKQTANVQIKLFPIFLSA